MQTRAAVAGKLAVDDDQQAIASALLHQHLLQLVLLMRKVNIECSTNVTSIVLVSKTCVQDHDLVVQIRSFGILKQVRELNWIR